MVTAATLTLSDFLLARYAADEAVATRAASGRYDWLGVVTFVLAECEAKRRIVAEWSAEDAFDRDSRNYRLEALTTVLRLLASVYADHADFRPEWRP